MRTLEEVIGANVREFRETRGFTQEELGAEIRDVQGHGWTRQAVWKAERGGRHFTAAELILLAKALDVTVSDLYFTKEDVLMHRGFITPEQLEELL